MEQPAIRLALLALSVVRLASGADYSIDDPSIFLIGAWSSHTTYRSANTTQVANRSRLDTIVTATDLQAQLFTGPYTITIDGSQSTINVPAGGFQWVPIFTGLSSTPHTVWISGQFIANTALRTDGTLTAPYSSYTELTSASFTGYGRIDGAEKTNGVGYTGTSLCKNNGCVLRFRASASTISLWGFQFSDTTWAVYTDGVYTGQTTTTVSSAYTLLRIATGMDTGVHSYTIIPITYITPMDNGVFVWAIVTEGGTGFDTSTPAADPPGVKVMWCGDSIVAGAGVPDDVRRIDWFMAGAKYGWISAGRGSSNARVNGYLETKCPAQYDGQGVTVAVLTGGVNDCNGGVALATFQTAMQNMITNTASKLKAGGFVLVRGILPLNDRLPCYSMRSSYVSAQRDAVSSYMAGNPSTPAYFADASAWFTPTNSSDGLHPNAAGYQEIFEYEGPTIESLLELSVSGSPTTDTSRRR